MKMKSIICGAMSLSSMMLMASDTPEVSDVVMLQASLYGLPMKGLGAM